MSPGVASAEATAPDREVPLRLQCPPQDGREPAACAAALLARIRAAAEQQFILSHGLQARPDEVAAVRRYERAFACHDSSQRARKLAELDDRLGDPALDADRRAWLEQFRATLRRLAAYEDDIARGTEPRPEWPPDSVRQWVEQAKLDEALYRRYGGSVGLTASGAYAHGGRAMLVVEYLARQGFALRDAAVEQAFFAALRRPPAIALEQGEPDFTPFWQRPLRNSYVPANGTTTASASSAAEQDPHCASVANARDQAP
jgi:hypothetical protein